MCVCVCLTVGMSVNGSGLDPNVTRLDGYRYCCSGSIPVYPYTSELISRVGEILSQNIDVCMCLSDRRNVCQWVGSGPEHDPFRRV